LSLGEQRSLLATAVRREAATILSLPEATLGMLRPLHEYGLDSLMAVELRNALASLSGARLPSSLLFDYPNIEALAGFMAQRIGVGAPAVPPIASARAVPSDPAAAVPIEAQEPLSEQALLEALKKELDRAGY
jgi:acyl carrier protein